MRKLEEFMSQSTDINDWNARRGEAKKEYSNEDISILDASGLIKKTLNKE